VVVVSTTVVEDVSGTLVAMVDGTVSSIDDAGGSTAADAPESVGPLSRIWVLTSAAAEPAPRTPTMESAAAILVFMSMCPRLRGSDVVW